ncbi:GIY-YIG nuclease family protein, partial [Nostoc sp. 'Peltigera malacea cyanobiont' DB3992]|uniref:GIY-YIG nuclease family protein n=1 Tax=Nostoc sp. 'Peltigera malacea cyanobiont' DB3992 TaxID=1206980 RepID=UPI000C05DE33
MKISTEAFASIKGKSGIYAISHISSGKVYIGSSKNLLKRWMQHKALLKKGTHHSWKLQADWNAYGENSFDIFILEEVEKHSDLC